MAKGTDRVAETAKPDKIDRKDRHGDVDSITKRALAVLGWSLVAFDHQLHGLAADRRLEHCACPRAAAERSASGVVGGTPAARWCRAQNLGGMERRLARCTAYGTGD